MEYYMFGCLNKIPNFVDKLWNMLEVLLSQGGRGLIASNVNCKHAVMHITFLRLLLLK